MAGMVRFTGGGTRFWVVRPKMAEFAQFVRINGLGYFYLDRDKI